MENPFKLDDPGYPYLRKPPIVCWLFNHVQSHAIEVDWRSRAPAVRDCFGCGWLCHAISLHHCLRCTRNHTNMFAGEITVFMGDISMFYEIKSHQSSMIIMSPIGGFHKWGYSQIIHFSGIFHYNHPSPFMGTTISIHFCWRFPCLPCLGCFDSRPHGGTGHKISIGMLRFKETHQHNQTHGCWFFMFFLMIFPLSICFLNMSIHVPFNL